MFTEIFLLLQLRPDNGKARERTQAVHTRRAGIIRASHSAFVPVSGEGTIQLLLVKLSKHHKLDSASVT